MSPMLITCLVAAASPSSAAAEKALARVQQVYSRAGDVSAKFTQIYRDKLRGKERRERGRIWAKADGKVRWTYDDPVRKDFVFDGRTAYFYEPENAQVTVFDRFSDSPVFNAMRFLWGQGNLLETFAVEPCGADCPQRVGEPVDAEIVVLLRPREPIAAVDRIVLAVDPIAHRVRRSVVHDPLGNRTEYRFSDVSFDARVADRKFHFERPEGVSEVRATLAPPADPPK